MRWHICFRFIFQPVVLARLFFILLSTWCAMVLGRPSTDTEFMGWVVRERWLFSLIGFVASIIIMVVEYAADVISSHKILMATGGLFAGLSLSRLIYPTIPPTMVENPETAVMASNLLFGYLGIVVALKHAERFHLSRLRFFLTQNHDRPKVLDTSVIIDGRIRELIDLKVIRGQVLLPNFMLRELQSIADSTDPARRVRGRRGLEVLNHLRESFKDLEVVDNDDPTIQEVDQKLVHLCRELDADLITNDYNLQKIASVHKITVINVNEIANALRPAVFIGEEMGLDLVRKGKEDGQAVGYLEDGTLVVVDDAEEHIGTEVRVTVSSILQTPSGRMVFARLTTPS